jgi:hypothetical protein
VARGIGFPVGSGDGKYSALLRLNSALIAVTYRRRYFSWCSSMECGVIVRQHSRNYLVRVSLTSVGPCLASKPTSLLPLFMNAPLRTAATDKLSGDVHSGFVTDPVAMMGAENVNNANANNAPAVTSLFPLA